MVLLLAAREGAHDLTGEERAPKGLRRSELMFFFMFFFIMFFIVFHCFSLCFGEALGQDLLLMIQRGIVEGATAPGAHVLREAQALTCGGGCRGWPRGW